MNITIKKSRDVDKRKTIWLPMEEDKLEEVSNELGIEMTTEPNVYIEYSSDKRFSNILVDKNVNIDELNYLMKRLDGFDSREMEKFYATAFAEETKSMADLINLSFNLHCYSLVNNFSDLNKLGKDLYLTEKMAVATRELDDLDGESYAIDVIENNKSARVTPYGVLYKNSNEVEQVYNGKHFPLRSTYSIVHCKTLKETECLRKALELRMTEIGLELYPERTQIAYCKDEHRKGDYPVTQFEFLGYVYKAMYIKCRDGKNEK